MLGVVVRRPFLEWPRGEAAGCESCEAWSDPRAGSGVKSPRTRGQGWERGEGVSRTPPTLSAPRGRIGALCPARLRHFPELLTQGVTDNVSRGPKGKETWWKRHARSLRALAGGGVCSKWLSCPGLTLRAEPVPWLWVAMSNRCVPPSCHPRAPQGSPQLCTELFG